MLQLVRTIAEPRLGPPQPKPIPAARPQWDDLDEAHAALWDALHHLFPSHANVTQTDYGCLMVSWLVRDAKRGCTHYAAPVIIRIEAGLLLALWTCGEEDRRMIAQLQEAEVAAALAGYDPHSRIPTCGVIVLGDG
jgi:hypothetical protein